MEVHKVVNHYKIHYSWVLPSISCEKYTVMYLKRIQAEVVSFKCHILLLQQKKNHQTL